MRGTDNGVYNELKNLQRNRAAEINDLRNVNQQLVNVVQNDYDLRLQR